MPSLAEVAQINPRLQRDQMDAAALASFVPMASVSEISGSITDEETRPVGELLKGFTPFVDGDVLVAKITPCFENGKIAHARIRQAQGFGSTEFHVIRPSPDKLDARYLFHFLRQPRIRAEGEKRMTGSAGQRRIPRAFLEELDIPLRSLQEQRRIAAILDKADALCAKRREAIAKLDQLLQSVFLSMFGDPATNPKGWPVVELGSLGEWRSGGTPARANMDYFKGDIPWYSSGELNDVYVSLSAEMITEAALRGSSAKLMSPGTLMVGMYDTAAFKSSITMVEAACNQAVAFSHLDEAKAEVLYVYQALQIGKEHFKRLQRGVRQKNLNLSMVRSTELPLPPLEMQRKFVEVFESLRSRRLDHYRYLEGTEKLSGALEERAFRRAN